jgi:DNA-binding transcriptional LysR family regulator
MSRSLLPLSSLRSFLAVAELGSVTRAAEREHLTQSAISLQIRRLEELLETPLFERHSRGVTLTASGKKLADHARAMLNLNDAAIRDVSGNAQPNGLTLGAPHDIIHPAVIRAQKNFACQHPDCSVTVHTASSSALKLLLAKGAVDLILTTAFDADPAARAVGSRAVIWTGAPGGTAWQRRPLPIAIVQGCVIGRQAIAALDATGISWSATVESESVLAVEAGVAADKGIYAAIAAQFPAYMEALAGNGRLPQLPPVTIFAHSNANHPKAALIAKLEATLADAFN